ncbi:unnamed protein product [Spirodela intermedia]|uniref:RecQ mediated genome instability protein 1 OB-fold domain-containing protein n=1 Tax=Spirodela intermedia TaxID=51605 RepID=A0A7I8IV07_SPIIN|nr:unnamed protein product [Spirodela intermedia]CAA6660822.1 unnamed protein product [Spirodela intermedia]
MEIASLSEALLKTLTSKGWCFEHPDEMLELIKSIVVEEGNQSMDRLLGAVESELLNMDLRSFGSKSLPDPVGMKKLSQLQGPLILQVVHARDIYQSSIDAAFKDSQYHHRLLRLNLTDGHTEVLAIEYTPIPSINEVIVPGTKVLLENKIVVRNGILCLNSKVVRIIGGVVQSLFDEWKMSQKYSGFSRSAQNSDGPGPPHLKSYSLKLTAFNHMTCASKGQASVSKTDGSKKMDSAMGNEGKARSSDLRPKEVIEATPVQNQAAAQKLLQKFNQTTSRENRHYRGAKHRGKERDEPAVFTLDEWERSRAGSLKPMGTTSATHDTSRDEELARQLQNQLDLEDYHAEEVPDVGAEQIKLSMFKYGRSEETSDNRREYGRRGRGRRSRGRGRGRFE